MPGATARSNHGPAAGLLGDGSLPAAQSAPASGGRIPISRKRIRVSQFPAFTHVAVTVSDLPTSVAWYRRLLDADPVLDEDTGPFHHVVFALDGAMLLGLHHHAAAAGDTGSAARRFDERQMGLDHVAFACADRDELAKWAGRLDELGVAHGGIVDAPYGSGLSFRDPDNIALEFFAPPA